MGFVEQVRAVEVLDGRGWPTVNARVRQAGRLGANAILAVSIAFARALAAAKAIPLWEQFALVLGLGAARTLPRLTVNLFSGGKHAGEVGPAIQDVLVVPGAARTIEEGLAVV